MLPTSALFSSNLPRLSASGPGSTGGLTIGCSGCGAVHAFGWWTVLRSGPAPLTLVSLGRWVSISASVAQLPVAPSPTFGVTPINDHLVTTEYQISAPGPGGILTEIVVHLENVPKPQFIKTDDRFDSIEISVWLKADYGQALPGYYGRVTLIDDQRAVSQTMEATREDYRQRGIPEATLLQVRRVLSCPLYSSSNTSREWWLPNEVLAPGAEKVWKRLVMGGWARYSSTRDRYVLP